MNSDLTSSLQGEAVSIVDAGWSRLKALVIDSLPTSNSKRAYGIALDAFFRWYFSDLRPPFGKAVVQEYRTFLERLGYAPSTIGLARFPTGPPIGARCKAYPKLRQALIAYMRGVPEAGTPSDRQVVDIMDAAQPATEQEIIECLRYLFEERGLRPGTRNGPRHFSWFRTVVEDYFRQKRDRQLPAAASGEGALSPGTFDYMTSAIESGEIEECGP